MTDLNEAFERAKALEEIKYCFACHFEHAEKEPCRKRVKKEEEEPIEE